MNAIQTKSRIAGILIILGIVVGIFSIVPSVEGTDFLSEVYPQRQQVYIGALFQFLLVPIYVGFAIVLYNILKWYSKSLSLAFVGFRLIAGTFQLVGIIILAIFALLSEKYLASSGSDLMYFETTGEILKLTRDLTNHLGVMLAMGLGNIILYYIVIKGKLLPLWLSAWGMIGNVLLILASFLLLFQVVEVISTAYGMMTIPLVIQEVVLAIWLISKGLKASKFIEQE